jgi:hypothetical protein
LPSLLTSRLAWYLQVTSGPDLSVTVDGIHFPNPFVIGSGPPGTNYKVRPTYVMSHLPACPVSSTDSAANRELRGDAAPTAGSLPCCATHDIGQSECCDGIAMPLPRNGLRESSLLLHLMPFATQRRQWGADPAALWACERGKTAAGWEMLM